MRDDLAPPETEIRRAVTTALAEDLGPLGDLTGSLLPAETTAAASFVARRPGVVAGTRCVAVTCELVDPALSLEILIGDGATVDAGAVVARVSGPFRSLLIAERTALNFLCHLSGIATMTRRFVEVAAEANPSTRILDTRKTTPGLRALEKAAVRAGGGTNHRGSLSDAVLIKDNHLAGLGVRDAVLRAAARWPGRMIEVECDTIDQVKAAAEAGATVVLCDNMTPEQIKEAVTVARECNDGARTPVLVEASGGVTLDTVAAFASAGADLVSVGALTHSAPILDIGLDVDP